MHTSEWGRYRFWVASLGALLLGIGPVVVLAQQAHADLSVSAIVTPPYFVPGGRNTVALTVHNAGPDAVDSGAEYSVSVFGDSYTITHHPPPYEVLVDTVQGCWAERFVIDLVPPNNDTILLFAYDFDALPAGDSLTCIYDIEFYPSTTAPFTFEWQVDTSGTGFSVDPNPSNNTFSYTLNAAPPVPSTPVPAGSLTTWLLLALGLLVAANVMHTRMPRQALTIPPRMPRHRRPGTWSIATRDGRTRRCPAGNDGLAACKVCATTSSPRGQGEGRGRRVARSAVRVIGAIAIGHWRLLGRIRS